MQRQTSVDRCDKARVSSLTEQGDGLIGGKRVQISRQFRFWTGIINDDQLVRVLLPVCEHAFKAVAGFGEPPVNGDDDVNRFLNCHFSRDE